MSDEENSKQLRIGPSFEKIDEATGEVLKQLAVPFSKGTTSITSDIIGGFFGDSLREWRTRNIINKAEKTAQWAKKKKIPIDRLKNLDRGTAYVLFEGMSLEDDVVISEMYSRLLINAINPESKISIEKSFVETLKNLTSSEIITLDYIVDLRNSIEDYAVKIKDIENVSMFLFSGANKKAPSQKEIDEHKKKHEKRELEIEEFKNSTYRKLVNKYSDSMTEEDIETSLEMLVSKNLISRIESKSEFLHPSNFMKSSYIDQSRFETLDERKVADAIIDIHKRIDEITSYEGILSDESFYSKPVINYKLSKYGERFMLACEKIEFN